MMTSLGGDKARGTRDKALPVATHTTQPQKQLQATAEQIRLAQMIYDKNDADFEDKVNQLMEVTGKNQDECMVALHDCNEDVNRAINFLLESTSDTTSWETVGKKKPPAKDGPAEGKENKENREKRGGEREGSRGRGGSNRRGRGILSHPVQIPSSAVEMPGSADVPGLNVQFGALDFGSEAALPDFGPAETCVTEASRESAPAPQSQTSLYSKPLSLAPSSMGTVSSSAPCSSSSVSSSVPSSASPFVSVGSGYDCGPVAPHPRLAFPQSKEAPGPIMVSHIMAPVNVCLGPGRSVCDCPPVCCPGKAPPNLSQGVPPLLPNQYIMGPGGLLPAYPIYGYEDLHMLQSRLPMDYYGITFPGPTALSGRDGSLTNNHYSGEVTKFGRGDSTSPAPPSSFQPPQPPQPQGHHGSQQQAFLPPGYSYTGLPYYPGMPGAAFQYGHTMFMPQGQGPAKQHGVGLGNPSASPFQQQQASGYGQHAFSSGYEDLTQGQAGVDYSKGYSNSSQSQAKSAATGPSKGGISVTSGNSGVPEISGSVYNKTQSFDKQGFHAGTPPPFNLPSALGGPGGAPGGYAPTPFLHILQPAHQQPHNQMLHHHLPQDGQGGPSLRGQSSNMQKSQVNKSSYGSSPYWGN
uniref:UBA domain-containing protein n=1 Tax=Esox lucius TaxID=8010 RepID=A0AAY5K4Q2_ESOLU